MCARIAVCLPDADNLHLQRVLYNQMCICVRMCVHVCACVCVLRLCVHLTRMVVICNINSVISNACVRMFMCVYVYCVC